MEREYVTTDLYIAAYLVTTGLPLLRIDGPERRKWFVFPSEAEEEARAYFNGVSVPARAFTSAVQDLKTQLFDMERKERER